MAKVEITRTALETLTVLEQYMTEYIADPESLCEQLVDITFDRLSANPKSCPVCPELEALGLMDYLQLTIDENYKIIYRYSSALDTVFILAFMRAKQSAEKLLVNVVLKQ